MDTKQYHNDLKELHDKTEPKIKALAQWAEKQALPWLWKELAGILKKKNIAPLRAHDAIRQGLQVTITDRKKMPREPSFYVAQMTMLDSEAKRYINAITTFLIKKDHFAPNATIYLLHEALESCLQHGIILLEQAGHYLLNLPGYYNAWSRRHEDSFEIFKGAEQIVYGQFLG